jgi:hypothetical protein
MATEPLPRAANTKHLTDALRRPGALGDGRVSKVVVERSTRRRPTRTETLPMDATKLGSAAKSQNVH